ncbi:MAG TPA: hypothetical protein VML19_02065 [Verrucomicrobiae bacterium]|nr:hypothetical protein [Verrucomicrobiae bacterium]
MTFTGTADGIPKATLVCKINGIPLDFTRALPDTNDTLAQPFPPVAANEQPETIQGVP